MSKPNQAGLLGTGGSGKSKLSVFIIVDRVYRYRSVGLMERVKCSIKCL